MTSIDEETSPCTTKTDGSAATEDARHRAVRTALQSFAFDVLYAMVAVLQTQLGDPRSAWLPLDVRALGALLVKTVIVTAFSFLMRLRGALPSTLDPARPSAGVPS